MSKDALLYSIFFCWFVLPGCANRETKPVQVIHDTVYIADQSHHILKGTTVLTASEANMESRAVHGIWLDTLESSECREPMSETPPPTGITSVKKSGDSTLVITASIVANCSYEFLGEIEVVKENTLNLIYHGYGGYAECNCCFGLTYKINLDTEWGNKFNKLKYVTINGFGKTPLSAIKRP